MDNSQADLKMTLTDKVIKNTYYLIVSQVISFSFPLILTPFIIGRIGESAYGIYALALGFAGIFGLFDMSISSSFIKFISEHYNKKEFKELNSVINTGIIFYAVFSLIFCIIGLIFKDKVLSLININENFRETANIAYIISLIAFLVTNSFGIFNSILVSLQKMYFTSILGLLLSFFNFVLIISLLIYGFGLKELLYLYIIVTCINVLISFVVAKKALPQMRLNPFRFHLPSLKKMTNFGIQMQISKLAAFISDKYDEYLLAFFSVISNVTFYNISTKIVRVGRFLPIQLFPQVAPIAAELNARDETQKISQLFNDTSKYLTIVSLPIFSFFFIFADVIVTTWMGPGFDISIYLLRILTVGQLINMIFSAPGNSIIPNLGKPKYQMFEGLIFLSINLVLSYLLIKYYGIVGAAFGNTISTGIASLFVFFVSVSFFKKNYIDILKNIYLKPFLLCILSGVLSFIIYYLIKLLLFLPTGRIEGSIILVISLFIFMFIYSIGIFNINYLNNSDKSVFIKMADRAFQIKKVLNYRNKKISYKNNNYEGELISIFIVTRNRLELLKQCIWLLLSSLTGINYEIIIWDNDSNDGTKQYLESLNKKSIKCHISKENIGNNAKDKAAAMCKGKFLVGIEDNVLGYPDNWLLDMIKAYKSVPRLGYLSTDVFQTKYISGEKQAENLYYNKKFLDGEITIQFGPNAGGCIMISREIFDKFCNITRKKGKTMFSKNSEFLNKLKSKGYRIGILKDVEVSLASAEKYSSKFTDISENEMNNYGYIENLSQNNYEKRKLKRFFDFGGLYNNFLDYAEKELIKENDK